MKMLIVVEFDTSKIDILTEEQIEQIFSEWARTINQPEQICSYVLKLNVAVMTFAFDDADYLSYIHEYVIAIEHGIMTISK